MLQDAQNTEHSTETSTSNDLVVDQLIFELRLLAKNINTWLQQNVDLKSRTNPMVSKFQLCKTHEINCTCLELRA